MNRISNCLKLALAAGCVALAQSAAAHYLWLETAASGARLYFGEVNEVREQSPGRLDEIPAPRVWSLAPEAQERKVVRRSGAFQVGGPGAAPLAAVETGYAVQDWTRHGIGVVKPMFYARSSPWPAREVPQAAELRLDVQPVPGAPNQVKVLFDGKPLAGAKVAVHAPNGWDQEHKTDDQGLAGVALPWRGQYVFEVIHREAQAGEIDDRKFEAWRHRATLTVLRRTGIDPRGTGSLAPRLPER